MQQRKSQNWDKKVAIKTGRKEENYEEEGNEQEEEEDGRFSLILQ